MYPHLPSLTFRPVTAPLLALLLLCVSVTIGGCQRSAEPLASYEYAAQGLYAAALKSNGEQAIVGSINHGASLWQVNDNARLFNWNHKRGEYSQVVSAAFARDTRFAVTATPQTMVLWNTATGEGTNFWTAPSEILDIKLLPNGNYALLGLADHTASIFDVREGGVKQVFYHKGRVNSVAVNVERGLVLSGSEDNSARLWRLQGGEQIHRWDHDEDVQLIALSEDGNVAFTMSKYDKAALWNTDDGSSLGTIPLQRTAIARGQLFTAAAFSKDGSQLLTGNADRLIQLWDVASLNELARWQVPKRDPLRPTSASILAVAFDTNGRYLAIASDGFLHQLGNKTDSNHAKNASALPFEVPTDSQANGDTISDSSDALESIQP